MKMGMLFEEDRYINSMLIHEQEISVRHSDPNPSQTPHIIDQSDIEADIDEASDYGANIMHQGEFENPLSYRSQR